MMMPMCCDTVDVLAVMMWRLRCCQSMVDKVMCG